MLYNKSTQLVKGITILCFTLLSTIVSGQLSIQVNHPLYQEAMTGDTILVDYDCQWIDGAPLVQEADLLIEGSCNEAPEVVVLSDMEQSSGCGNNLMHFEIGVQDSCGNSGALSFYVQTTDVTAPVFLSAADTVWANCIENVPLPEVADNTCLGSPVIVPDNLGIIPICDPPAVAFNRTIFAIDACGNASTHLQTVFILDTIPPTLIGVPADGCELDQLPVVTAIDDCTGAPLNVQTESVVESTPCGTTTIHTWSAIDACGNIAVARRTFVPDAAAPVLVPDASYLDGLVSGDTIQMDCDLFSPDMADMIVVDGCAATPLQFLDITTVGGPQCSTNKVSTQRVEWLAADDCGNTSSFLLFVELMDYTAPQILNVPADTTIMLGDTLLPPTDVLFDDCSLVSDTLRENFFTTTPYNVLVRVWQATDVCDRFNFAYQVVLIDRDTATLLPPVMDTDTQLAEPVPPPKVSFFIAPNAAHQQVRLAWPTPLTDPVIFEVVDALGRVWLRQKHAGRSSDVLLEVDGLPAGVYWVVISASLDELRATAR